MKTVFLLSLLSLLFSIPGLAEVRTIRTSSLFGNKQVVFQGLAAFPDGGRYSYSVESERTQNGDDPATARAEPVRPIASALREYTDQRPVGPSSRMARAILDLALRHPIKQEDHFGMREVT